MIHSVSIDVGGKKLTLETGKLAKQAGASVYVSYGDTRVLVTVCSSTKVKEDVHFFPLTVEFAEKFYAAGKIPGSFHRREGRPTQESTLSARMIDRQVRPLFPEGFHQETQIVASVLSLDPEADIDFVAAVGASAALHLSNLPFQGPTAAVKMGRAQGQWIINPSWSQLHKDSNLECEVMVAGTAKAIMMVEGGAREISEEEILEAIMCGHKEIQKIVQKIEELRSLAGKPKIPFSPPVVDQELQKQVEKIATPTIQKALQTQDKQKRQEAVNLALKEVKKQLVDTSIIDVKKKESEVETLFELLQYRLMREMILNQAIRIDGRNCTTVRPISVEVGLLPRVHGSALFTRGETQVLSTVTFGTSDDEQIVDTMFENSMKKFMLHYNFPPFSVGEAGRMGGQSRREIGHGALAERSIKAVMPRDSAFPYTIRLVCETLESNGSSSMGSVCSSSMALMNAGAPLSRPVAGIAMGLIKEQEKVAILTDILGDEDHLGDMDFKVAGTTQGVTGIQMDIKIEGVNAEILKKALAQAREGRLHILQEMSKGIETPNANLSLFAPRITTLKVPVDKIREVIGSGGKVIKEIIAQTGCKIDINDDGTVNIASVDGAAAEKAVEIIRGIIAVAEVDKVYKGIVKKIVEFGAFVEVLPNQDGLLHISEIAHERVQNVEDHLQLGQEIEVKVLEMDRSGKIRLSRRALLPKGENKENHAPKLAPRQPRR